jgi:hypothetical protein
MTDAPPPPSLESALWAFVRSRVSPRAWLILAVFAAASVGYGAALVGARPSLAVVIVVSVVMALLAFQLAIADALRDQTHKEGRWDEPVGRAALLTLGLGAGLVQALLTLALHPPLLGPLALAWLVIGLVAHDFFVPDLARRPGLSVGLHLTGLAAAGLYAACAEPLRQTGGLNGGLIGYVVLTLACGFALEIARKLEAPLDERLNQPTYSKAWGPKLAGMAAGVAGLVGVIAAGAAYLGLSAFPGLILPVILMGGAAALSAIGFGVRPIRARADRVRWTMTAFVILAFACLGLAPLLLSPGG